MTYSWQSRRRKYRTRKTKRRNTVRKETEAMTREMTQALYLRKKKTSLFIALPLCRENASDGRSPHSDSVHYHLRRISSTENLCRSFCGGKCWKTVGRNHAWGQSVKRRPLVRRKRSCVYSVPACPVRWEMVHLFPSNACDEPIIPTLPREFWAGSTQIFSKLPGRKRGTTISPTVF